MVTLKKNNQNNSLFDLNYSLWRKKMKNWNTESIKVVCISDWLKNKAKESLLFKNSNIHKINCDIDPEMETHR